MEWKPIETAPKDGTAFLAFDAGEFMVVKWDGDGFYIMWEDHYLRWSDYDSLESVEAGKDARWQPLPEPPPN